MTERPGDRRSEESISGSVGRRLAGAFDSMEVALREPRVRRTVGILLWVVSGLGYLWGAYLLLVVAQNALVARGGALVPSGGAAAWDSYSTWLASQHLREGSQIYATSPQPGIGEIYYPPLYVQLTSPLGLLPWAVFGNGARLLEFLALRGLAGSWRATGIWLLYPPVVMEVNIANIVLLTAFGASIALRGRTEWLPVAAIPKLAPILAAPAAWRCVPEGRRRLVVSAVLVAVAVAISWAISPQLWADWVDAVRRLREYGDAGLQTGFDSGFFTRIVVALLLVALSFWRRWPLPRSTALLATLVGLPALRDASFAMLCGVPLLFRWDYDEARGRPRQPLRIPRPSPR